MNIFNKAFLVIFLALTIPVYSNETSLLQKLSTRFLNTKLIYATPIITGFALSYLANKFGTHLDKKAFRRPIRITTIGSISPLVQTSINQVNNIKVRRHPIKPYLFAFAGLCTMETTLFVYVLKQWLDRKAIA